MVNGNRVVPNQHFHKKWDSASRGPLKIKTHLDQASKKKSRRIARAAKAAACAPAPVGQLRPAVHCPTQRYNAKVRLGRGFTLAEVKAAGITAAYAKTIGICVDARRSNKSQESLDLNTKRITDYLASIVVFPKRKASADIKAATQFAGKVIQPLAKPATALVMGDVGESNAFISLRKARKETKIDGQRAAVIIRKAKEQ
jgi:large subunit ribosomal protein L13e